MTSFAIQAATAPFTVLGRVKAATIGRALRAPLLVKLLGANLLIVLAAITEHMIFPQTSAALGPVVALGVSFTVTALLVWVALRPIAGLENVAARVSTGDFGARVPTSQVADAGVARLATTLNRLLDRVQADRARIEYLAGRSVRARDIERESVARELRESLAQMASAVALGIAAARRGNTDAGVDRQLEVTRQVVDDLTDQMRGVAEALYPGTIAEFGLGNALRTLGRVAARRSGLVVDVDTAGFTMPLTPAEAAALYRVADEALRNVAQHAQAVHARVRLASNADAVELTIEDDGHGLDVQVRDPLQAGLGLFSAKSVLALVKGELQISSAPGRGSRVLARISRTQTA